MMTYDKAQEAYNILEGFNVYTHLHLPIWHTVPGTQRLLIKSMKYLVWSFRHRVYDKDSMELSIKYG